MGFRFWPGGNDTLRSRFFGLAQVQMFCSVVLFALVAGIIRVIGGNHAHRIHHELSSFFAPAPDRNQHHRILYDPSRLFVPSTLFYHQGEFFVDLAAPGSHCRGDGRKTFLYAFSNISNIASELIATGLSFASYSEDLPATGATDCDYNYYTRLFNVSPDFDNVPGSTWMPFSSFPTDFTQLPTVTFVIPNMLDDMHGGDLESSGATIQNADTWLQQHLNAYPQWAKSNNSLLILHWDEDEDTGGTNNHIPSVLYGPMVQVGQFIPNTNSLIKIASTAAWDSGATSNESISSGNGSVQVTAK